MKAFYTVIAGIILVGGGALVWAMRSGSDPSPPPGAGPTPVAADDGFTGYVKGSPEAPVEIVEYADFECPACVQFSVVQVPDIMERLVSTGRARWRFRDFPLESLHPNARLAARAGNCAGEQGRFWEMHDFLFFRHQSWAGKRRGVEGTFEGFARELGLDSDQFASCLRSAKYDARINASVAEGISAGVTGTPTIFINGQPYTGRRNADAFVDYINRIAPPAP